MIDGVADLSPKLCQIFRIILVRTIDSHDGMNKADGFKGPIGVRLMFLVLIKNV
jgi:hypothetical protein